MPNIGAAQETTGPYTTGIAAFVAGLRYEAIPDEVRHRVKLLLLDSLGCGLYGVKPESSGILIRALQKLDRTPECAVWGTAIRMSAPHAALVNGTLIQSFELDDIHTAGLLHVGCAALPPLIALAESRGGMSGKDLMRAAVAGYEVGPRVGMCMGQQHLTQGWHASATIGVFAAATAAAAALRLSAEQVVHVLGMAATQASGLMAAQFGSMVKRMHAGRSAQSGLYSALLAAEGFTGIVNVFESEYGGFCTTFSRSRSDFDLEELTRDLGARYETMNDALKFYSCAASNHSALDAIRAIRRRRPFRPDEVERIVVHGSEAMRKHVYWKYRPESVTTAQMNMPFTLATLVLEGDAFVDQYTEESIREPARVAFAEKVDFVEDREATAGGAQYRHKARVVMHFAGGETEEETVEAQRGSPKRFASDEDVIEKFRKLASHVLPESRVTQVAERVLDLEHVDDTRELTGLLCLDQ